MVKWSDQARNDLKLIKQFIDKDSQINVRAVAQDIAKKAGTVAEYPMRCKAVPEFNNNAIREISCHSWRIIFHIRPESIAILAVVHKRRILQTEEIGLVINSEPLN